MLKSTVCIRQINWQKYILSMIKFNLILVWHSTKPACFTFYRRRDLGWKAAGKWQKNLRHRISSNNSCRNSLEKIKKLDWNEVSHWSKQIKNPFKANYEKKWSSLVTTRFSPLFNPKNNELGYLFPIKKLLRWRANISQVETKNVPLNMERLLHFIGLFYINF